MKGFLLLLILPCLVASDKQCPDNNTSCPDDKRCCEVNGQYTCCDADEGNVGDVHILEGKMKVYAGEQPLEQDEEIYNISMAVQHGILDCNMFNCEGKCCHSNCCKAATSSWSCCPDGKCCPRDFRCCPVGCCPKKQDCCGGGCCDVGQRCCGTWCCKKKQQCGVSLNSCYGKGANFTPAIATVLLLAAAAVMSRHL